MRGRSRSIPPILIAALAAVAQPAERLNFIALFGDDQGWADLGVYRHPDIRTPHVDRMAAPGMRFTSSCAAPF